MLKKIRTLFLVITLILLVQTANATLAPMLPESSYDDGNWQGFRSFYEEPEQGGYLFGRVDFAVYDTDQLSQQEEDWVNSLGLNQEERFIYAYQVFNDYDQSDREIAHFEVFAQSGAQLGVESQNIDTKEDEQSGIEPSDGYLDSAGEKLVWAWDDAPAGNGLLYKDNHSWYLVFLSDSAPVLGDFNVKALEDNGDFPVAGVPEPATIVLFGVAQAFLVITGRKKSLRKNRG